MVEIVNTIYKQLLRKLRPLEYAQKVGVNMKGALYIYGTVSWGTEPWIISVGNNVHITQGVSFVTHDGGTLIFRKDIPDLEITKPISLGDNVYIGNNVYIMPGVNIGSNIVIGACSVVTKDLPDNGVYAGNPARYIKSINEYLEKLKSESLHLGHLHGQEKDCALMEYYKYMGDSKGIYF